ncbi:fluoride efflux transporter CrcB [Nocardia camponoti]|uniref:Fluoride-specific ion channel FluC n=1 Tax=Nocardia camponoti TaxID=1616106 RepID=A0A917VE58_9NOCA|nr:fluoride efflux transporter CrcB [Nocardia camponoti]GGK66979.1 putative fluoride ion transporter CrcB [Nocardia camponoti]
MMLLWVALAGSAGAVARFVLDGVIRSRVASPIPWSTITINLTGSLLLGVLAGLVLFHGTPTPIQTVLGVGFCGGYTTFSTASYETVRLIQQQRYRAATVSALGTLALCVAAGAAGLALAAW